MIKRWKINRDGWLEGCESGSFILYDDYVKEAARATPAEPDADVRNEIIEQCAKVCDGGLDQVYVNGWVDCANERKRCADAIRALARNGTEAT